MGFAIIGSPTVGWSLYLIVQLCSLICNTPERRRRRAAAEAAAQMEEGRKANPIDFGAMSPLPAVPVPQRVAAPPVIGGRADSSEREDFHALPYYW